TPARSVRCVLYYDNMNPTSLTLRELEDEIATLAAHIYAGTCRWLELVAELDERGSWTESGAGSCAEWLAWRCALSPRAAREHVRGSAEPRFPSGRPTNVDALLAMSEAALAARHLDRSGGERYQVVVNVDPDGGATLEDGPPLARETAERLSCDASVVHRGRKARTIPPSTRRALRTRDRGCRFPGCENRRFVDAHHIRHWAHGGATAMGNL